MKHLTISEISQYLIHQGVPVGKWSSSVSRRFERPPQDLFWRCCVERVGRLRVGLLPQDGGFSLYRSV